jgi:hypothetical protein
VASASPLTLKLPEVGLVRDPSQDAGLYQDRDVSKLGFKWADAGNLSRLDG